MDSLPGWHVCLNYFSCWLSSAHVPYSLWTHGNHVLVLNLGRCSLRCIMTSSHHVYTKTPSPLLCLQGERDKSKEHGRMWKSRMNRQQMGVDGITLQAAVSGWNKSTLPRPRAGSEDYWICSALWNSQLPLMTCDCSFSPLTPQINTTLCTAL